MHLARKCVYSGGEAFPAILTQKGHARTHPQHDARNLCGEWNRDRDPNQSTGLGPGVLLADDFSAAFTSTQFP